MLFLGTILEYYDFIIFGFMVSTLSIVFDLKESTLFLIYALGYCARPLGGIVFGYISDYISRKTALIIAMSIMAACTLSIGLLPTHWGIMLIVLRTLQGLSFAGELPNAVTLTLALKKNLGTLWSATSIGTLLAVGINAALFTFFSKEAIISTYWRVPFIIGALLGIVIVFMRRSLPFTNEPKPKKFFTFHDILSKPMLRATIVNIVPCAFVMSYVYLPSYLMKYCYVSPSWTYKASTIGMLCSAMTLPFLGMLLKKYSSRILLCCTAGLFGIVGCSLSHLAAHYPIALMCIMQFFTGSFALFSMQYVHNFLKNAYTGIRIGLSYNIAYAIGGFFPSIFASFTDPKVLFYALLSVVLIGFCTVLSCNKENIAQN